jgi:hypothetical protein
MPMKIEKSAGMPTYKVRYAEHDRAPSRSWTWSRRPAFGVPQAPPAVAQRAARQPLAAETMPDAMAAYVLEPLP